MEEIKAQTFEISETYSRVAYKMIKFNISEVSQPEWLNNWINKWTLWDFLGIVA